MPRFTTIAAAVLLSTVTLSTFAASVDVYGKIDTALHIQKNRGESAQLTMQDEASRFGFRIAEKLTDDVTIKGYLENGFTSDTGAFSNIGGGNVGSTLFDRRSILAVASKNYGELGFGRLGSVRSTISPYSLAMGFLDPFETGYGDIASISNVFGNDPRGNNSVAWVSPRWAGFKFGLTGSLSTTDQESDHTNENTRLLSAAGNYENGVVGFYAGVSKIWYGYDKDAQPKLTTADAAKNIEREDAEAYLLGATWKVNSSLKLFAAGQYQKDWRSVAGWNIDTAKGGLTKTYTASDKRHGIDGWSGLFGAQMYPAANLRILADVTYFDGSHKMDNGKKLDARRTIVNTAAEYSFSKTTKCYATLSHSWGSKELNTDAMNTWISHIGLQHWF